MDNLNQDIANIKSINDELVKLSLLDAYVIIDSEKNLVEEFYRDYLNEINLEFFKEKINVINESAKQILLTEKGMIYIYKSLAHHFILLAGFRESADIYSLQSELDKILTDA
ncbi:MAG: hypothetical protein HRT47_02200 [Candidatus Caenarcaniphilales bacterium]|nr:hypothetical protein [Candidatus Caenarcaniphilales bacterium]